MPHFFLYPIGVMAVIGIPISVTVCMNVDNSMLHRVVVCGAALACWGILEWNYFSPSAFY